MVVAVGGTHRVPVCEEHPGEPASYRRWCSRGCRSTGRSTVEDLLAVCAASLSFTIAGPLMSTTTLMPFQPDTMTAAQQAAVSYLARYNGHTHAPYAYQLRRWFSWCETNHLDPLVHIQRAHVELYIRHLDQAGLMASSVNTAMHAVRGFFRFAHIDGLITADPAIYARLPKVHQDETRTQGLDRLELIRFL